jgi:hypothetical protein
VPRPAAGFYWGVDVGVSALSALLRAHEANVSVKRAFLGGLAGGTLMYAGQRLVGTAAPAVRLVGLQTVALGAGIARNVGAGRAAFSDLTFPLFPFYVRIRPGETTRVSVRLSALGLISAARMGRAYRRWPSLGESLLGGAPVFTVPAGDIRCDAGGLTDCQIERLGEHSLGAVVYAEHPAPCSSRFVVAHEMGHVAQDVRDVVLFAVPASDLALAHAGRPGRWLSRYLVVDGFLPLMLASRAAGPPAFDEACRGLSSYYECETEAMLWRKGCAGAPAP